MKCIICNTSFCYVSFGGPAEPCDCGQEVDKLTAETIDPEDLKKMRDTWAAVQAGTACGECGRPFCKACGNCHWCLFHDAGECTPSSTKKEQEQS